MPLPQPTRPLSELLSSAAVRLDVPYVPQSDPDSCAVACLDMLTRTYRLPLSPGVRSALAAEARSEKGLSGAELKAALEASGYFVAVFPGTLGMGAASIPAQLGQGHPILVMLGKRPRHDCVVAGYDPVRGLVEVLDPDPARRVEWDSTDAFEARWKASHCFSLLAVPATLLDPAYRLGSAAGPGR